jgi:two-component system, chemotaxis family, chemotaxis protein CheY
MAYSILVVDDSKTIRTMVRKTLELSGLALQQVHEAASGAQALAILNEHWVDIVLADIHMPEIDGVELVERMSQSSMLAGIPVVMISSDRELCRIERLKALGIRAFLNKPFRPEALRDVVKDVLGEPRSPST